MDDVVDTVFDDFEANIGNNDYFKSRVLLAATNAVVNEVNDELIDRIPGDIETFTVWMKYLTLTTQQCFLQNSSIHLVCLDFRNMSYISKKIQW